MPIKEEEKEEKRDTNNARNPQSKASQGATSGVIDRSEGSAAQEGE